MRKKTYFIKISLCRTVIQNHPLREKKRRTKNYGKNQKSPGFLCHKAAILAAKQRKSNFTLYLAKNWQFLHTKCITGCKKKKTNKGQGRTTNFQLFIRLFTPFHATLIVRFYARKFKKLHQFYAFSRSTLTYKKIAQDWTGAVERPPK